jgi:asparagine synthase (glutamine-hydrolysing)
LAAIRPEIQDERRRKFGGAFFMCSIMGFEKRSIPFEKMLEAFSRSASRGPDMSRVEEAGKGWLCFHRLAIMGLTESGMQPFALDGDMVVCNGELYGFRPLKERLAHRYGFESDSDCELLLPLYREYGLDMFSHLDAEFAMILYDSRKDALIAARDPIGIRPLYYGRLPDGSLVYASEPKNLVGLVETILPSRPAATL